MMRPIDSEVRACRECARFVWNLTLREYERGDTALREVESALFNAIVVDALDHPSDTVAFSLNLRYSSGVAVTYTGESFLASDPHGGKDVVEWDMKPGSLLKGVTMYFGGFFDFGSMTELEEYRDFEFIKVHFPNDSEFQEKLNILLPYKGCHFFDATSGEPE